MKRVRDILAHKEICTTANWNTDNFLIKMKRGLAECLILSLLAADSLLQKGTLRSDQLGIAGSVRIGTWCSFPVVVFVVVRSGSEDVI